MTNSQGRQPMLVDLSPMISGQAYGDALAVDPKDYWPTAWASFGRQEGDGHWHAYGLPVFGGDNLIFYNRDCFRRAGVELPDQTHIDQTWTVDDFVKLTQRLTIRGDQPGGPRVVQWGFNRPFSWLYWLPFIYACDADILSADRSMYVFTDDRALAALQLWDDLNRRWHVTPAGADLGPMGENVAFLTGRVAMATNGPWAMPFFNDAGIDYGVLFPPLSRDGQRGTRVTWDGVGLAGRLRNDPARRRLAYELARHIVSPASAEIMAEAQRSIPANLAGREALVRLSGPNRAEKFVEAMEFARVEPITKKWDGMDWALRDGLAPLTRGQSDAPGTLRRMAELIQKRGLFPVRWPDGRVEPPAEEAQP